jgi:hypothetical protein
MSMDDADYGDSMEFIDDMDADEENYDADEAEVDQMLDALIESDEDMSERKKRQRRGRAKNRPVPAAKGTSAYREPAGSKQFVTQKQLETALARVGADVRRNATGIKTLNTRVGAVDRRVDGVVSVNTTQSAHIAKLDYQMRVDGALDLASAFNNQQLSLPSVFRGAVKSGLIGDKKGSLGSPLLIGVVAFVLQNNPNILGNLLPAAAPAAPGGV